MTFLNNLHIFKYGQNKRGSMKILFLINNNCDKDFIEIGKTKYFRDVQIKLELEKKIPNVTKYCVFLDTLKKLQNKKDRVKIAKPNLAHSLKTVFIGSSLIQKEIIFTLKNVLNWA